MNSNPVRQLDFILNAVRIPSIPTVFSKVSTIAYDPRSSIHDMSRAIEEDQAIAARTLKIANSAAFGLRSRVSTVEQACATLGMLRVRTVVLQTSLIQNYSSIAIQGFDLERFWRHTTLTGIAARQLVQHCLPGRAQIGVEEAYTCGLLHDIGIVVMLDSFPSAYIEAINRAHEKEIELQDAEHQIFGFDHCEVGAALSQKWKFPEHVVLATRWHHEVPAGISHENICLLVHTANHIAEAVEDHITPLPRLDKAMPKMFTKLGICTDDVEEVAAELEKLAGTVEV